MKEARDVAFRVFHGRDLSCFKDLRCWLSEKWKEGISGEGSSMSLTTYLNLEVGNSKVSKQDVWNNTKAMGV